MKKQVALLPAIPGDGIVLGIRFALVADLSFGDKPDFEPVSTGRTMPEECPYRYH